MNRWLRRELERVTGLSERTLGRQREKNLDQAEKGLEFTLGNAVSRTGKT